MKKRFLLKIQSLSDIITNSSSEVFVMNSNNDALKELIEKIGNKSDYYLYQLTTEDDVKNFLIDLCVNESYFFEYIDGFIDNNILKNIFYDSWNVDTKMFIDNGISIENIVNLFFPLYKELVGKVILQFNDDCSYPDWINDLLKFAYNNNLIEFEDRV